MVAEAPPCVLQRDEFVCGALSFAREVVMSRLGLASVVLLSGLLGCGDGSGKDSGVEVATDNCGDIDGSGGDSGDVPNLFGKWTITFGTNLYDSSTCDYAGYSQEDMRWLQGNMEIDGRLPDAIYAELSNETDTRFYGLESSTGGVVLSGSRDHQGDTMYVAFGGLLYEQPLVDRDEIRGFGYIGVDLAPQDTVIDCLVQGEFLAKKSGN